MDSKLEQNDQASAAEQTSTSPSPNNSGVLRLRGLPFAAGPADIEEFMKEYGPLTQVFICKRNGRSTGEAFVQFADIQKAPEAMAALQRATLGPRYVEIFEATESDLQTAKTLSQDRMKGFVVRLRGLPYTASAADVLRFLNGVEVVRGIEGVVFTFTPEGRPTGECFVELQSDEGQKEAMKRHKELMGTRYIELFTSTKADLIQAIQHNRLILGSYRKRYMPGPMHHAAPMMYHAGPAHHGHAGHVHMGGHHQMPYMQAAHGGVEEVTDLFSGLHMLPGQRVNDGQRGAAVHGRGFGPRGPGPRGFYQQGGEGGRGHAHMNARGLGPQRGGRGYRPVAPQQAQQVGYNVAPLANGNQAVLLQQQPYIIQQQQYGGDGSAGGFAQANGGAGLQVQQQQEQGNVQYFSQQQAQQAQQQGSLAGLGPSSSYLAPGPGATYTLIQLPSGSAANELHLGGGMDAMGQMHQMQVQH